MSDDGWERVTSGFYAKSHFRIQRGARGWSWWDVVQLEPRYARGWARSLREAKYQADSARAARQGGEQR